MFVIGQLSFCLPWKSPLPFFHLMTQIESIATPCGVRPLSVFRVGTGQDHSLDPHFHGSTLLTGLGTVVPEGF